jgi:hypothetical protein
MKRISFASRRWWPREKPRSAGKVQINCSVPQRSSCRAGLFVLLIVGVFLAFEVTREHEPEDARHVSDRFLAPVF